MSTFFSFVFLGTFIWFIILWRKKVSIKKNNGVDSKEYKSIKTTKRIVGVVCVLAFVICGVFAPNNSKTPANSSDKTISQSSSKTTNSSSKKEAKTKEYTAVRADVLLKEAKDNAMSAQKKYKGKSLKITNAKIMNIESEGDSIIIEPSSGDSILDYEMLSIHCFVKDDKVKEHLYELKKGQPITVYCTVDKVGDLMGYYPCVLA